jgi:ribosomal protein L11 methyltransferase
MMHQASIEAAAMASAERIVHVLENAAVPQAVAVGLFEKPDRSFEIFAHYEEEPSRAALLALIAQASDGDATGSLRIETLPAADWVTLSQGKRGKVEAGRFLVHGSHDRARVARRRLAIEIDAGQAFGTAHHASTRGCLLALDHILKRRRPRTVLDLGTGSGVLAIAAAKALGRGVMATDSDPLAVTTALENARKNNVKPLVGVLTARGFDHPALRRLKADLLLANLLERALYALAPALARHIAGGGLAILSGLTETQVRAIEARLRAHGFILEKRIILDGWTTLVISRHSARKSCD